MKNTLYADIKNVFPENAVVELDYPVGLNALAEEGLKHLEGAIAFYWRDCKIIVTDESCDLDHPRWTGTSLDALEEWLEGVAVAHDNDF